MTAAVRDIEGERERLLADVSRVRHDTLLPLADWQAVCLLLLACTLMTLLTLLTLLTRQCCGRQSHRHQHTHTQGLWLVQCFIVDCGLWTVSQAPMLPHCCLPHCPRCPAPPHTHALPLPQAEALLSTQRAAVEEAEQAVQEALRLLREAEVGLSGSACLFW